MEELKEALKGAQQAKNRELFDKLYEFDTQISDLAQSLIKD